MKGFPKGPDGNYINSWKPKIIQTLLGKDIKKIACGGVHNICLVELDNPFNYELFKLMRTQQYCDFEIIIENNISTSIKCHKFVLRSRSSLFNIKITSSMKSISFKNYDITIIKYIIDYIYLNDSLFLEEIKNLDVLLDLLKITK